MVRVFGMLVFNLLSEVKVKSLNSQLRSREKKAFTLIELLVVIAIIALLLSILTPALRKVKGKAQNLICSTNLRSLFTAWAMYSSSNDGKLCNPYTRYGSGGFPKEDESSWAWVPWDKATESPAPGVKSIGVIVDDEYRFEGIRRGSLWAYTGDVDVYHCIAEHGKYGHFRSYSIVDCMGGYWGRDAPNWIKADSYGRVHIRADSISRPSNSYVFLEENDPRPALFDSFVFEKGFMTDPAPAWGDSLTVRHQGASSFGFADGHTEFRLWSNETVKIMEDPETVWGTEPQTSGGKEDIQWMIGHWSK